MIKRAVPLKTSNKNQTTTTPTAPTPAPSKPSKSPPRRVELPDIVYYVDVDNFPQKISAWDALLDAIPDSVKTYVVFVMNVVTMRQKTGPASNLYAQFSRHSANIATIVTPAYPEEADNVIEGHLRQMMRLKDFKRANCSGGYLKQPSVKVDHGGYYFNNASTMEKRCSKLSADATKFVIVSSDKDFTSMVQEILHGYDNKIKPDITVESGDKFSFV